MSQQVLHLDFVSINPSVGSDAGEQLIAAASRLAELTDVLRLGAIEAVAGSRSDFDLVCYFLLSDFSSLEPFGTDARYASFLQGEVAPRLRSFAGADIRLDAELAPMGTHAACLALAAPDETYDWEVREALNGWCLSTGAASSAIGLAVGEKQLYRGAALVFADTPISVEASDLSRFHATTLFGTARSLA